MLIPHSQFRYKYLDFTGFFMHFSFDGKFPESSVSKESACNAGDLGSVPGSGRFPGEGNGNPLRYSCLENPMDRVAWQATVHGVERVGHNLATKPPPPFVVVMYSFRNFDHIIRFLQPSRTVEDLIMVLWLCFEKSI